MGQNQNDSIKEAAQMYGDAYPLGPETDLWRLFAKNLPTRTYEKDQMIYWQEEQADCLYCNQKGG